MPDTTATPVPDQIRLVPQRRLDDCAIATTAMIVGVSYREAWDRLAPPPSNAKQAAAYNEREMKFLNEKGWWASAQLLLKTVLGLDEINSTIESDEKFNEAVEKSQRVRLILAFADGAKPDHSVIWDRDNQDVFFDPSRGIISGEDLFNPAGLQTYSGVLGLIAYRYRPGQPILTLLKMEEGFEPPSAAASGKI